MLACLLACLPACLLLLLLLRARRRRFQVQLKTPGIQDLRTMFSDMHPHHRQIGLDDTLTGCEWFVTQRERLADAALAKGSQRLLEQYTKRGVPSPYRRAVWAALHSVGGGNMSSRLSAVARSADGYTARQEAVEPPNLPSLCTAARTTSGPTSGSVARGRGAGAVTPSGAGGGSAGTATPTSVHHRSTGSRLWAVPGWTGLRPSPVAPLSRQEKATFNALLRDWRERSFATDAVFVEDVRQACDDER